MKVVLPDYMCLVFRFQKLGPWRWWQAAPVARPRCAELGKDVAAEKSQDVPQTTAKYRTWYSKVDASMGRRKRWSNKVVGAQRHFIIESIDLLHRNLQDCCLMLSLRCFHLLQIWSFSTWANLEMAVLLLEAKIREVEREATSREGRGGGRPRGPCTCAV